STSRNDAPGMWPARYSSRPRPGSPSSQRQSTTCVRIRLESTQNLRLDAQGRYNARDMRRRLWVAAGVLLALSAVALAGGATYLYVWDRGRSHRIADGVTVAGFDVGGMRAADARAFLEERVAVPLRRPVRLVYGRRAFTVRPEAAGLDVDVS